MTQAEEIIIDAQDNNIDCIGLIGNLNRRGISPDGESVDGVTMKYTFPDNSSIWIQPRFNDYGVAE